MRRNGKQILTLLLVGVGLVLVLAPSPYPDGKAGRPQALDGGSAQAS